MRHGSLARQLTSKRRGRGEILDSSQNLANFTDRPAGIRDQDRDPKAAPNKPRFGGHAATFLTARTHSVLITSLIASCLAAAIPAAAESSSNEQVWLAVSDVHLNIFNRSVRPSPNATDTNATLFESALRQMERAAQDPAVVLLPGDFLVHNFRRHVPANAGTPDEAGIRTMRWIAGKLGRAFPKAQFAIALGNNDAPCGDYKSDDRSAYLAAVGSVWAPLINRNGASPDFSASFLRGGYYTSRLPLHGLRLVVLNTVLLSSEYGGNCGGDDSQAASDELAWLRTKLRGTPSGTHNVVMMHVPPGFDAFSTDYVHGFLTWPFLKPRYNPQLVEALAAPSNRIIYAIAGHTHRFDFRLAGGVPIVVLGSLSPVYGNNPAFYTLRVLPNGSIRDVDAYTFDESIREWQRARSFDRSWNVTRIDAPSLAALHARLGDFPAARALWGRQANGWPIYGPRARGGWQGKRWRVAWCAQALLIANFAQCAGIERRVRALYVLVPVVVVAVAVTLLLVVLRARSGVWRRLRR